MFDTSLWGQIPFVGRRTELRRLSEHRARLEGNNVGGRHMVLLEGFSGVGKTTLVEDFLTGLSQEGRSFTIRGAYNAYLRRPPLAPLLDALDELFSHSFARQRLISLFTDQTYQPLMARLPILSANIGVETIGEPGAVDARTLASLIASILCQAARFRPVVLLLDDVQWMPEEDRHALSVLNAGLRNTPVLFLMTIRREDPDSRHLLADFRAVLLDHVQIPPLTQSEVGELVTKLCGPRIAGDLTPEITRASEGLPFRVIEILRVLAEQGALGESSQWKRAMSSLGDRFGESASENRLRLLDPDERRVLLLLDCAGGIARRDEMAEWFATLTPTEGESTPLGVADFAALLERLEASALIRPAYANPEQIMFAHDGIGQAQRQIRSSNDVKGVASMLVSRAETRANIVQWIHDVELFVAILQKLENETEAVRAEVLDQLLSVLAAYRAEQNPDQWTRVYEVMIGDEGKLRPIERARALSNMIQLDAVASRFPEAVVRSEQLYALTETEPECRELRAIAATRLATSRFYNDRAIDVTALLEEAESTLERISNADEKLHTEMLIAMLRTAIVPPGKPAESMEAARQVYHLAERLSLQEEKYRMLGVIVVNAARTRNERALRFYCNELLNELRNRSSSTVLSDLVINAVRSAVMIGDIFQAREMFETWCSYTTPVDVADLVAHSYLTALFAMVDGEPSLAADIALQGRDEYLKYCARSSHRSWKLIYRYASLRVIMQTALIAAGRYAEALQIVEQTLVEEDVDETRTRLPDGFYFEQLLRVWLTWRCMLPVEAPLQLAWPNPVGTSDAENLALLERSLPLARPAAEEFRRFYQTTISTVSPPARFFAEMLLVRLEATEHNFDAALDAIARAVSAYQQMYAWMYDLECRAAAVTIRLRQAQHEPMHADELVEKAMEDARELFGILAEKGQTQRLSQLATLFHDEARKIPARSRDYASQFERFGSVSVMTAHEVMRNSRSELRGPTTRTRLYLMGPLRLMRPYSYMEISETAFERETARTLLTALVAAEVLGRRLTREELAAQVAPNARTPEQQKKTLYNAVSSARGACGSHNSIVQLGSTSMGLNVAPDLEGSVWVDALEIMQAMKHGEELERGGAISGAFDEYQRGLMLARKGEFGSDCYAEWIDEAREVLREVIRQGALAAARLALRGGMYTAGIEAMTAQLTRDPYDEECHRTLIRLYAESGNRSAALKQFEKCRAIIQREFGVEPERETLALRKQILSMTEVEEDL